MNKITAIVTMMSGRDETYEGVSQIILSINQSSPSYLSVVYTKPNGNTYDAQVAKIENKDWRVLSVFNE
jgi:hypothetical protein